MEYISQTELILNLILSAILFGVIWMVQLVVYPGFRWLSEDKWTKYHNEYTGFVFWVVMPLMLAEFVLNGWLVLRSGINGDWFLPFMIVLTIWLSTFFIQVPQHNKLSEGKDDAVIHKLIRGNWIRTLLWSFKMIYISFLVYEALL